MNQMLLRFVDYSFSLSTSGDIYMDSELSPDQLQVETGDKFEVVVVPGVGVVFKKIA